jgi:NAD(P)-dependent dehydrogenase (short-subunit alcohol dehydrogenase family)
MQIKDNVFIVTGGASGLGGGTSRVLAANGGKVVIADVQADKAEALARELGARRAHHAGHRDRLLSVNRP